MHRYIVRRLVMAIPVLLGVLIFTFLMLQLTPGDPARVVAGPDAPPHLVEQVRVELGLDKPAHQQFVRYVSKLLQGDLGESIITKRSVTDEFKRLFPHTLELVVLSMLIAAGIGIPLGIFAATRRGSFIDSFVMSASLIGLTMPIFSIGLVLMWYFGFELRWLPIGGRGGSIFSVDGIKHALLPAVTLALNQAGSLARLTRSTMLEVLGEDYVRTARAKGLAPHIVTLKHALKNASLPVITVMGLQFGHLLGGAVVTETVFSWPGLGRLMVQSIMRKDFPVVQSSVLIFATAFIFINLLVDLLYAYLNPRIRYD